MPTTANCESQYVYDVSQTRIDDVSTTRWRAGSKRAPTPFSFRTIHSPFWNAVGDVPVRESARDVVGDVEADPDHELEAEMRDPAW